MLKEAIYLITYILRIKNLRTHTYVDITSCNPYFISLTLQVRQLSILYARPQLLCLQRCCEISI